MHSKKHNDCLTIPIGLSTDNDTVVEMAFSCGGSSRGINGFQVFTPDETAIINHILENGRRKYNEEELDFQILHCDKYYDLPIKQVFRNNDYIQIKSYQELFVELESIQKEIHRRMDLMEKNNTPTFHAYQQKANDNCFSQKIIFVNELFHLNDNMDETSPSEQQYENYSHELIRWLSRVSWHFGVYFVFLFRYDPRCYPYSSILGNFMGRIYCSRYCGQVIDYEVRHLEEEIRKMGEKELYVFQDIRDGLFCKCKSMIFENL